MRARLERISRAPSRKYFLYGFYFILGFVTSVNEYSVMMRIRDFGLSMADISYLRVFPSIPWFIKFLFGGVSDNISICGLNRKPYIIVMNILAAATSWLMLIPNLSFTTYIGLLTLLSSACAWTDVIYDAMMVEDSRGEPVAKSGRLQVGCKYARSFGRIVAALGPYIWDTTGDDGVYAIMSGLYVISALMGVLVYDLKRSSVAVAEAVHPIELDGQGNVLNVVPDEFMDQHTASKSFCFQLGLVRESFKHPVLRTLLLYAIFIGLSPSSGLPTFYFINDVLKFSSLQMSFLNFAGEMGQLVGLTLYYKFFMHWKIRTTYILVSFLAIFITLVPLALVTRVPLKEGELCGSSYNNETSNQCYLFEHLRLEPLPLSLSDDVFGAVLDELRSVPLERVTAVICITAVEATVFSTMLSIKNLTWATRAWIDAAFIRMFEIDHGKFASLPEYIKFCAFFEGMALLLAFALPKKTIRDLEMEVRKEAPVEAIRFRVVSQASTNDQEVVLYTKEKGMVDKAVDEMISGKGQVASL